MSFTHHSPGPVANVEALLPGKVIFSFRQALFEPFRRAPPVGYINQGNVIIHHRVKGMISSRLHGFPFLCYPRTHSRYTVCVVFDKLVL